MKTYKAPKGFTKTDWSKEYHLIDEGAPVYVNPLYVAEDESPRKYFVVEFSHGFALLADNKAELKQNAGHIYSIYDIDYFKNF